MNRFSSESSGTHWKVLPRGRVCMRGIRVDVEVGDVLASDHSVWVVTSIGSSISPVSNPAAPPLYTYMTSPISISLKRVEFRVVW